MENTDFKTIEKLKKVLYCDTQFSISEYNKYYNALTALVNDYNHSNQILNRYKTENKQLKSLLYTQTNKVIHVKDINSIIKDLRAKLKVCNNSDKYIYIVQIDILEKLIIKYTA